MSQPVAKKAAVSGFFSKNKPKKGGPGGGSGYGDGSENSMIKSSELGVPGVSDASGAWDDSTGDLDGQNARDTALSGTAIVGKGMSVADLVAEDDDFDDEEKARRNIEAQDARHKLQQARENARIKNAATAASQAVAPAPAPAEPIAMQKWKPKSAMSHAEQAASSSGRERSEKAPNIKDEVAFPTLGRAMSGLPPGAIIMKKDAGLANFASRNQWAEFEDYGEDEGAGEGDEGAKKGAAAAAEATQAKIAVAAAPAAPDMEGPAADGLVRPLPTARVFSSDKEVKAEAENICKELRESRDYGEALRRFREEIGAPAGGLVHSRVIAAESIALFALDCTSMPERLTLGKLIPLLVPARLVSRAMLNMAIGRVNARLDVSAWASDYPKAKEWLVDILSSGAIVGGKLWHPSDATSAGGAKAGVAIVPPHDAAAVRDGGYVPLSYVHKKVGAIMKLNNTTATQLQELGRDLDPISTTLRSEYEDEGEDEGNEGEEERSPVTPGTVMSRPGVEEALRKMGVDADGPVIHR